MATALKQPGDTEEDLNPARRLQEQETNFDSVATNHRNDNSGSTDSGSVSDSKTHIDQHGDKVQNNYNSDEPTPDEAEERRQELQDGEKNPSMYNPGGDSGGGKLSNFSGRLGAGAKRFGPSGGIAGMVIAGFIAVNGGGVLLGGSLLINVKEIFHNDRADATRTNRIFSRATISNMFKNAKKSVSSKIAIVKKVSTMSKERMKQFFDKGFTIKGDEIDPATGKSVGKIEQDPNLNPNANSPPANSTASSDNIRGEITEIDFPDKTSVKSGADYYAHADANPEALREVEQAFPSKASYYMNKFFDGVVSKFDKFTKAQKSFPEENDKNAQDQAFDEQINDDAKAKAGEDPTARTTQKDDGNSSDGRDHSSTADSITTTAEADSKLKSSSKAALMGTVVQSICSAYRLTKNIQTGLKIYHMARLGAFALMFLQAADEIKNGSATGPKVTYLADNLTSTEKNPTNPDGSPNPKYDLSATDSDGYKTAAHGDQGALKEFAEKYALAGGSAALTGIVGSLKSVDSAVEKAAGTITGGNSSKGRSNVKTFCRMVNGEIGQLITSCATVAAADTAVEAVAGGPFGIGVGKVLDAVMCGCVGTSAVPVIGDALSTVTGCKAAADGIGQLAEYLIKGIVSATDVKKLLEPALMALDVNSSVRGVDAGNAIAAGAGLMLATTATGYGLHPSSTADNHKDIQQYIGYTQPLENKYIALDKQDGKQNPLDVSNQYSFLGSFMRSFDLTTIEPSTLYGSLASVFSVFGSAKSMLTTGTPASALYNQPSTAADPNGTNKRYNYCTEEQDADLADIGATGDKFCTIVGVSDVSELKQAQQQIDDSSNTNIQDLAEWMATKQPSTADTSAGNGDQGDCANIDGSKDGGCSNSEKASIGDDGTPTPNSEYDKYLNYCTDQRKYPYGTQQEPYEQGSTRDQRWYTGEECMKSGNSSDSENQMVSKFRMWTNYCLQIGTMDGATNCYKNDVQTVANVTNSTCGDGTTTSIYTCALLFDKYGYDSPGADHGADALGWYNGFKSNPPADGTPLLDCSGLVMAAVVAAFGKSIPDMTAPGSFTGDPTHWESVPKDQAKRGDLVVFSVPDAHVEIIKDNDTSGQSFSTFGAHTQGIPIDDQISESHYSYGAVNEGTWRYKNP